MITEANTLIGSFVNDTVNYIITQLNIELLQVFMKDMSSAFKGPYKIRDFDNPATTDVHIMLK